MLTKLTKQGFLKRVNEVKSSLTDKEVFYSEAFKQVVAATIQGICKQYKVKFNVRLDWLSENDYIASTGTNTVNLNLNNALIQGADRKSKYKIYLGCILHECGHRLWTNFKKANESYDTTVKTGVIPSAPFTTDFLSDKSAGIKKMFADLFFNIQNALEDAYIEIKLMSIFRGYGKYLSFVREIYLSQIPTYEEMTGEDSKPIGAIMNMILSYAKYGFIPADDEEEAEKTDLWQRFMDIAPVIEEARTEPIFDKRLDAAGKVLDAFLRYLIEEEEKKNQQNQQNQQNQNDESENEQSNSNENPSDNSSGNDSGSEDNNSSNQNNQGSDNGDDGSQNEDNSSTDNQGTDDGSNESESSSQGQNQLSDETLEDLANSMSNSSMVQSSDELLNNNGQKNLAREDGSKPESGDEDKNPEDNGNESGLSKLEDEVSTEKVEGQLEKELGENLSNELRNLGAGSYHENVDANIERAKGTEPANFHELMAYINPTLRRLISEFLKEIKNRQEGDVETGLFSGTKVNRPYRFDKRCMSKKTLPQDIPDMSVMLLIDMSGSMDGENIEAARLAALLLYRFCKELGVRVSVYGHGTGYSDEVELRSFAEFDAVDRKDLFRIASIDAENWCNRDGYAIRFCAEKLVKESSKEKIFIIISDGAPNAGGYSYHLGDTSATSRAKADIDDILTTYGRKGIAFITAGLSSDRKVIEALYTDGLSPKTAARYLDISDLNRLPKTLVNILKKEIDRQM